MIATLDPTWLSQGTNKAWVDMLVRDFSNPSTADPYFPFSRSFDWYHGHSWAKGLFESADGKDEESSSEDAFASYGIKMWGQATGNAALEGRGNLMLAIQARSLNSYFLMRDDNVIQPATFIGNKVTGIVSPSSQQSRVYKSLIINMGAALREQGRPRDVLWYKHRVHPRVCFSPNFLRLQY